jgi:hypothetical protein
MSDSTIIDDLFAKLPDFADRKAAKLRFDELFEQARQEEIAKVQQAAERIEHKIVANGHDKPKRGRRPKHHEEK